MLEPTSCGERFDLASCDVFAESGRFASGHRLLILRTKDGRFVRALGRPDGFDETRLIDEGSARRIKRGWNTLWSQPGSDRSGA